MKYIFLGVIALFLFSCSGEKLSTDEKVAQLKNATNYTNNTTETQCGTILYAIEEQDVKISSYDTYMGDGGSEVSFYYWDNDLIFCEYYSFYDGPMMNDDGTYSQGGEPIGSKYKIYYKNGKMDKCLKDGVVFTDFEEGYDPDTKELYEMSKKIILLVGNTESEILCF